MWKTIQDGTSSISSNTALPPRPEAGAAGFQPTAGPSLTAGGEAFLGKGLIFKGEIAGAEPLFIEGIVEGSINLPGSRVILGPGAQVKADITARDIVVQGRICGNIIVSNRADIRAEGAVTGDVTAARLSVEDGAFFKGGIQLSGAEGKRAEALRPAPIAMEWQREPREAQAEAGNRVMEAWPLSA
jgi:cytoskeletal protein CcmA (bactofilin family)